MTTLTTKSFAAIEFTTDKYRFRRVCVGAMFGVCLFRRYLNYFRHEGRGLWGYELSFGMYRRLGLLSKLWLTRLLTDWEIAVFDRLYRRPRFTFDTFHTSKRGHVKFTFLCFGVRFAIPDFLTRAIRRQQEREYERQYQEMCDSIPCYFCGGDGGNDCRCSGAEALRCEQDAYESDDFDDSCEDDGLCKTHPACRRRDGHDGSCSF